MTDEKILSLFESDERSGFEALIRQYSPYIVTVVRSRLGAVCTADEQRDAVSDIFVEILTALRAENEKIGSLKAYISVIAVRHCIGVFRKKRTEGISIPLDELPERSADETEYDRAELIELLRSLGEPDCEIFIRRYFLGQKSAEIAEPLGLRPNTVDQKISRGLKRLREMIGG